MFLPLSTPIIFDFEDSVYLIGELNDTEYQRE